MYRSGGRGSLHVGGNEEITGSSSGSSISLDVPTASTVVYLGRLFKRLHACGYSGFNARMAQCVLHHQSHDDQVTGMMDSHVVQ